MSKIIINNDKFTNQNYNDLNFIKHSFKKQEFKKHFHTNYSIGLIIQGIHSLQIENKKSTIIQGEIKIINPYELHIANGNLTWQYLNFMPNEQIIKNIAQDMCDDDINCEIRFKNYIKDTNATQFFLNLFKSLNSKFEYEENLIILISYLLKHYAFDKLDTKQIPKSIQNSIEFIHTYFYDDISLETLSNISNISKYHLIKIFKHKTGLTPHQYIINLRLEYSLKLIKKNIPLSQVAYECGFSDQSHFIKTFRKYYGLTPSLL
jgi:AraC-like DNA-binding protein